MCDEVTDVSIKEQMSVVLRYVDSNCNIKEEFADRITGEALASKLKEALGRYGLDLKDCHGQGYDGASNMSGSGGVQGILSTTNPKAVYMHCNSHYIEPMYCSSLQSNFH